MACGKIAAALTFDCLNPPQAGTADKAIIINYDDWNDPTTVKTYDVTNKMILTDLTLPTGKKGYYVEGRNNSNQGQSNLIEGTYVDLYDHLFNFVVFDLTNDALLELQNMTGGRYVVILERNYKGATGESAFIVLGGDAGLKMRSNALDTNANDGTFVISMASTEIGKEGKLPLAFFDTSYATTKAAFQALTV